MTREPLILPDLDEEEYHSHTDALSASMAKVLIQPGGPAKLRHQLDHGQTPKRIFDFGHAAHQLVLGVGKPIRPIPTDLLTSKGAITPNARAFIDLARDEGAVALKAAEVDQVKAMADQLLATPDAMEALHAPGARHELSVFYSDPETGADLRCRFDSISEWLVADYKTAADADPGKFARRTILDNGLHIQAAHYIDSAATVGLIDPDAARFQFVVQDKTPPYLVAVVTMSDDYLDLGRYQMRRAIRLWADCLEAGVWPGYPSTVAVPPLWATEATITELDPAIEAEFAAAFFTPGDTE